MTLSSNKEIIDTAIEAVSNLENIIMIYDVSNFESELQSAGLMTPQLQEFIENYLRWDND